MEALCSRLRGLAQDCIDKHLTTSAIFYADKLVTFSNYSPGDVYLLAQAYFAARQFHRALSLLRTADVVELGAEFTYLAGCCLAEAGEWEEVLALLGDDEAGQEPTAYEDSVSEPPGGGAGVRVQAGMAVLRGRAFEALENRGRAATWYKAALGLDPYCYDAFAALVDGHLLSNAEEVALVESLRGGLAEGDGWLGLLMRARCKKYLQPDVIEEALRELEAPAAPPPAEAEAATPQDQAYGIEVRASGALDPAAAVAAAAAAAAAAGSGASAIPYMTPPLAASRSGGDGASGSNTATPAGDTGGGTGGGHGRRGGRSGGRKGAKGGAAAAAAAPETPGGSGDERMDDAPASASGPHHHHTHNAILTTPQDGTPVTPDAAAGGGGGGAGGGGMPPGGYGCGLGGNIDVLACRAELLFHRGDYEAAYVLTRRVLCGGPPDPSSSAAAPSSSPVPSDPYALQLLPVHVAAATQLAGAAGGAGPRNDLFLLGHRLTEEHPDMAVSWYAVGCYYLAARQPEAARRYLGKATQLQRGFAPAWLAYGHAFSAQDERDQAMSAYRTATRLFPGLHTPHLGLGAEYCATANLPMAERSLLMAYDICPDDPAVCHELGVLMYKCGQVAAASMWLDRALALLPGGKPSVHWEPTLVALGHCLRKLCRFAAASECYSAALSLAPASPATLSALGFAAQLAGDPRVAVERYHAALALRPDDPFTADMLRTALQEYAEQAAEEEAAAGGRSGPATVR